MWPFPLQNPELFTNSLCGFMTSCQLTTYWLTFLIGCRLCVSLLHLRRYKHFDWLYARLVERFPVISVPHLPEKQATGRFEEDFIAKRRKGLIWWMNHMTSHPVLARCDVFQHFLTCGADEKAWKQGKRKAEKDELVGANFFLTIRWEAGSKLCGLESSKQKKRFLIVTEVHVLDDSAGSKSLL